MRIIFYTGKGGVGKTTIAAATGMKLAQLGYRTIVISLDVAHSLRDAFDSDVATSAETLIRTEKQMPVGENLWIQEINIQEAIAEYWDEVYNYIRSLLNRSGLETLVAEEIAVFPGMEEICALLYINQYVREKTYDVIILDCAPTGESLRFVSIPTTLEWYMNRIFKLERNLAKVAGPVIERVSNVPLPRDSYFQNIQSLFDKLEGIDGVLTDPKITTVRLVTNPEKIVIKETQRAFMYFCLYGLCIDAVIINRIFPEGVAADYFELWKQTQRHYIQEASHYFSDVPIWKVNLFSDEIVGKAGLQRLGDSLYADIDPAERFSERRPYQFQERNGAYQLTMRLPFLTKEEIELTKRGDELIVTIGGFKRHVALPRSLANRRTTGAKLSGAQLVITFETG
ncbi:arsenic-transporting ATPase [Candidatus Poribacteria bacterium]|nr:MAG: arsenic-transporting ATPase [Candidatus Poribacteria bacterium]